MSLAEQKKLLEPVLKWPGGKRWFVKNHIDLFPNRFKTYFEPFLGGAAVYFHLSPEHAVLADINNEIIAAYNGIKANPKYIHRSLAIHQKKHSLEHYYSVRSSNPRNTLQQASRMIYLNRTCFNGIFRVNGKGEFNVPIGSKSRVLLDTDDFEAVSSLLKGATILNQDFEVTIDMARKGDFIFADPPYTIRHNLNGFIKYNEKLFSWEDQERLAETLIRAKSRGVKLILTNANHQSLRDLYKGAGFKMIVTSRYSSISASAENRRQFEELIIYSI